MLAGLPRGVGLRVAGADRGATERDLDLWAECGRPGRQHEVPVRQARVAAFLAEDHVVALVVRVRGQTAPIVAGSRHGLGGDGHTGGGLALVESPADVLSAQIGHGLLRHVVNVRGRATHGGGDRSDVEPHRLGLGDAEVPRHALGLVVEVVGEHDRVAPRVAFGLVADDEQHRPLAQLERASVLPLPATDPLLCVRAELVFAALGAQAHREVADPGTVVGEVPAAHPQPPRSAVRHAHRADRGRTIGLRARPEELLRAGHAAQRLPVAGYLQPLRLDEKGLGRERAGCEQET